MKRITKVVFLAVGFVVAAGLAGSMPGFRPLARFIAAAQAASDDVLRCLQVKGENGNSLSKSGHSSFKNGETR